jgi:AcrR family transcriptional regulator
MSADGSTAADGRRTRAKRKDAALNNERLIAAAREVFAREGLSATLEDIAKQAGVGVGTIYRNFASKREIIETLYDAAVDSALAGAETALAIEDPWLAIVTFFEVTAASQAEDRGLRETFLGHDDVSPNQRTAQKIIGVLTPLFERATEAGVLRDGIAVTDIYPIFAMLDNVYRISDENPYLWRRYLALLLDGLRAGNRSALPAAPLDIASFTTALSAGH